MASTASSPNLRISRSQLIGAIVLTIVVCVPLWYFKYGNAVHSSIPDETQIHADAARKRANAEICNFKLLPFAAEALTESSKNPERLNLAREHHIRTLARYIKALDDSTYAKDAAPELRTKLDAVRASLEADHARRSDPKESIASAGLAIKNLYKDYASAPRAPSPATFGNELSQDVGRLCTQSHSFEDVMKTITPVGATKEQLETAFHLCEYACLDSRVAFLVIYEQWQEQPDADRRRLLERFLQCLTTTKDYTRVLAKHFANSNPERAATLVAYEQSMGRRLEAIQALIDGKYQLATDKLLDAAAAH